MYYSKIQEVTRLSRMELRGELYVVICIITQKLTHSTAIATQGIITIAWALELKLSAGTAHHVHGLSLYSRVECSSTASQPRS